MPIVRKETASEKAIAGVCNLRSSVAGLTNKEAATRCSLLLVHSKGVTWAPNLFVEDKYAVLAGEAHFQQLAALSQEHRVIR
jgi:hypothetical protein